MNIKILGTGCQKCQTLETRTREVVSSMEIQAQIEKVDDMVKIMEFNIFRTPGLVINGKVVVSGRLPSEEEIRQLILEHSEK